MAHAVAPCPASRKEIAAPSIKEAELPPSGTRQRHGNFQNSARYRSCNPSGRYSRNPSFTTVKLYDRGWSAVAERAVNHRHHPNPGGSP